MYAYNVHVQPAHYAYVLQARTRTDKHTQSRAQASCMRTSKVIYMRKRVHYRQISEHTFITACIHYSYRYMNA